MLANEKAVIIGGGISGKLAARVLSESFKEVIILERDQEPSGPIPRKGAPQGQHLHALLLAGQHGLEELFPGITDKFHSSGAVKINSTNDLAWFHHGVWKLRYEGGYSTTLQTRPHLEWHIEQAVKKIPNVSIQYHQAVKTFLYKNKENRIAGVQLADGTSITADLIIDASGVSGFSSRWLQNQSMEIPEEKIKIGLSYVTKMFQLPKDHKRDWQIKIVYPNPPQEKFGGTISRVEGNRYIVTINGYHSVINEQEVIHKETGFLELAQKLSKQDIYEELKNAVPLSQPSIFQVPQIIWRKFHQVINLPKGLLLIGDTLCRIDPVFGQGMSIAILEALALRKVLQNQNNSLRIPHAFHKRAAKIISPIWSMVITEDFRYKETIGKKPIMLPIMQWYARNVFLLSEKNQYIFNSFVKVMNLIQPSTILMNPKILIKVIKQSFINKQ